MNLVTFTTEIENLHRMAQTIAEKKRPDYTQGATDVLANFKDAARDAGITPMQAWAVHFQKQYSAVCRWAKKPDASLSEPLDSRFADLLNYIGLGYAIYRETVDDATHPFFSEAGPLASEIRKRLETGSSVGAPDNNYVVLS
jgi:hypothetical protein